MPFPITNEGHMIYTKQLNNHNLSAYSYHDKTRRNYFWYDSTAKRGHIKSHRVYSSTRKILTNGKRYSCMPDFSLTDAVDKTKKKYLSWPFCGKFEVIDHVLEDTRVILSGSKRKIRVHYNMVR